MHIIAGWHLSFEQPCSTCKRGGCHLLKVALFILHICIVQCVLLHSIGKIQLLLSVGLAQAHSITNRRAQQTMCGAKACTICGSAHVPCKESPPHAHVGAVSHSRVESSI